MADGDSSDYSSTSSDSCSLLSDDETEIATKPTVPQRPRIFEKPREVPGTSSDGKQENKGHDPENLESREDLLSTSNSEECDPSSQKRVGLSEKSVDTSEKCDKNSKKCHNDTENFDKVEQGNTLNNFLEIRKKSPQDNEALPKVINKDAVVPGGFQETDSVKVSTDKNSGKESNSSDKSEMGETKYKEITQEPEEQAADGEITDSTDANCGTLGCENVAVIPGLQEIQEVVEGDDDDDDDNDEVITGDDGVKSEDFPVEKTEDKIEETPVEEVLKEATVDIEKDKACQDNDAIVECEALKTEISPGDEGSKILQQETGESPMDYTPPIEIDSKAEDEKDTKQKQISKEMDCELSTGGEMEQEITLMGK